MASKHDKENAVARSRVSVIAAIAVMAVAVAAAFMNCKKCRGGRGADSLPPESGTNVSATAANGLTQEQVQAIRDQLKMSGVEMRGSDTNYIATLESYDKVRSDLIVKITDVRNQIRGIEKEWAEANKAEIDAVVTKMTEEQKTNDEISAAIGATIAEALKGNEEWDALKGRESKLNGDMKAIQDAIRFTIGRKMQETSKYRSELEDKIGEKSAIRAKMEERANTVDTNRLVRYDYDAKQIMEATRKTITNVVKRAAPAEKDAAAGAASKPAADAANTEPAADAGAQDQSTAPAAAIEE